MDTILVHGIPGSPFTRAVMVALEEKGARYRLQAVPLATLRAPAHLVRHPFGRVPVIEHGTFRLYETQAILRYVDCAVGGPALTPTDPRAAALMDQLMNINDWYLFHGVNNVIAFQRVVAPRLLGRAPDESAIAAAVPKAHIVIDALAGELGTHEYFVGDDLTLADVLLAPQLDMLRATPEWAVLSAQHANLQAWAARMAARPSMMATTWDRMAAMAEAA
jgi:glutathione S-transferase